MHSESVSVNTSAVSNLPLRKDANSPDNSFEFDPVMYMSHRPSAMSERISSSHRSTSCISSTTRMLGRTETSCFAT